MAEGSCDTSTALDTSQDESVCSAAAGPRTGWQQLADEIWWNHLVPQSKQGGDMGSGEEDCWLLAKRVQSSLAPFAEFVARGVKRQRLGGGQAAQLAVVGDSPMTS